MQTAQYTTNDESLLEQLLESSETTSRQNVSSNKREQKKMWKENDEINKNLCTCVAWLSVRWRGNALSNLFPTLAASAEKLIYLFTYEKIKPGKNFACSSWALILFCACSPFLCLRTIEDTRIVCSFWFQREFSFSLAPHSFMLGKNFSLKAAFIKSTFIILFYVGFFFFRPSTTT